MLLANYLNTRALTLFLFCFGLVFLLLCVIPSTILSIWEVPGKCFSNYITVNGQVNGRSWYVTFLFMYVCLCLPFKKAFISSYALENYQTFCRKTLKNHFTVIQRKFSRNDFHINNKMSLITYASFFANI